MKKTVSSFIVFILSLNFSFSQTSVWEISKNENSIYLGGSVHVLRIEDFPLPKAFDIALENSTVLVFETDIEQIANPATAQKMMERAMLPEEQTLQTVLNENVYKQLDSKCTDLGLPIANMQNMKPVMLINILNMIKMQQLGFTPQGVDAFLFSQAKEKNKEIDFLETIDFQIELITSMGDGFENEFVLYSLEEFEKIKEEIPLLIKAWKEGENEQINIMLKEMADKFPSVYQAMFLNRNNEWLPKIENYLSDKKVAFVIVGLAHMYGDNGLLNLLKEKGYTIKQVQ